jgi:hypothetical protein
VPLAVPLAVPLTVSLAAAVSTGAAELEPEALTADRLMFDMEREHVRREIHTIEASRGYVCLGREPPAAAVTATATSTATALPPAVGASGAAAHAAGTQSFAAPSHDGVLDGGMAEGLAEGLAGARLEAAHFDGLLHWRCKSGHVFLGCRKQMSTWITRGRGCPTCELLCLANEMAALRGYAVVHTHFVADPGEVLDLHWQQGDTKRLREAARKGFAKLQQRAPPAWFTQSHSQPLAVPAVPANFGVHSNRCTTIAQAKRNVEWLGVKIEDEATLGKLMGVAVVCWECAKGHRWSTYERLAYARAALQPVRGTAASELRKCLECDLEGQRALFGKAKAEFGDRAPPPRDVRGYHPANVLRQGGCRDAADRATAKCLGSFATGIDGRGNFKPAARGGPGGEGAGSCADDSMGDESVGSAEAECARILACSAHATPLAVLGLREAGHPSIEDVRRRFRHLAMRLHPDKCSLPRADEAFKRASEAVRLLDI